MARACFGEHCLIVQSCFLIGRARVQSCSPIGRTRWLRRTTSEINISGQWTLGAALKTIIYATLHNVHFVKYVYLPTEQAETNICWIIYQDATFKIKICLSLLGWKENILDKMHIVQCCNANVQFEKCTACEEWKILYQIKGRTNIT